MRLEPLSEVVSQLRNIASMAFRRAAGVSFKLEERRETGKETPATPVFIAGQAKRSMLVGGLNLMGLPGETIRRMVPSKGLLINVIAAWKTASRRGGGVAVISKGASGT
jgi:hypothetical protein